MFLKIFDSYRELPRPNEDNGWSITIKEFSPGVWVCLFIAFCVAVLTAGFSFLRWMVLPSHQFFPLVPRLFLAAVLVGLLFHNRILLAIRYHHVKPTREEWHLIRSLAYFIWSNGFYIRDEAGRIATSVIVDFYFEKDFGRTYLVIGLDLNGLPFSVSRAEVIDRLSSALRPLQFIDRRVYRGRTEYLFTPSKGHTK